MLSLTVLFNELKIVLKKFYLSQESINIYFLLVTHRDEQLRSRHVCGGAGWSQQKGAFPEIFWGGERPGQCRDPQGACGSHRGRWRGWGGPTIAAKPTPIKASPGDCEWPGVWWPGCKTGGGASARGWHVSEHGRVCRKSAESSASSRGWWEWV